MSKNALNNRVAAIREAKPLDWELPLPKEMADAREHERRKSYKYAILKLQYDMQLECAVLDYHHRGAKVALKGEMTLPEKMTLVIPDLGLSRDVKLVWRSNKEAGLMFLQAND